MTAQSVAECEDGGSQPPVQKPVNHDEESPLLGGQTKPDAAALSKTKIASIVAIILLGEFLANIDGTLMTAAGPTISSKFGRLEDLNWLTTAYMLGVAVVQPTLGKLSDVFGRKAVILVSYFLFALGRLVCGLSGSMSGVIIGRAVGGTGGAGMTTMASVIVTDLVPKRDLAMWRGYVNLIMTLGRSLGGPIGGFLIDYLGWRWLFLSQVPFVVLAIALVAWKMDLPKIPGDQKKKSLKSGFQRIDFLGSILAALSVVAGLVLLDMGGQKFSWTSPWAIGLAIATVVFGISFVLVEAFVAAEPVFSLHLLKNKDVVLSYVIMPLQGIAQMAMMFFVPLYFQVTTLASNTAAGAHLVPAVAGNAVGTIITGYVVRKTGRFKIFAISAGLIGAISYLLLILQWHGNTGFWESLEIVPGGFGMGICGSVIFVAMAAAVEHKDMAMATSGLFQSLNISVATGITLANSILRWSLQSELEQKVKSPEIIDRVMSDVGYVRSLQGNLRRTVASCYVTGLQQTYCKLQRTLSL